MESWQICMRLRVSSGSCPTYLGLDRIQVVNIIVGGAFDILKQLGCNLLENVIMEPGKC
jgi:hypothetical protein